MVKNFPKNFAKVSLCMGEYENYLDRQDRRLYLTTVIDDAIYDFDMSKSTEIVDDIIAYNREDRDIPREERKPIRLYINSPGGDVRDGFAIVGAIRTSKTPVYTINIGQWSSMAFLIGITGHKRFSLPNMTFLMHDGNNFMFGTTGKVFDQVHFEERYENEVVREHVLKYGKMLAEEYDEKVRKEVYMLPEDALRYGFIDKIVESLDEII